MIHNVLARQLPVDAGRVTAALAAAGSTPTDGPRRSRWGSGSPFARRSGRSARTSAAGGASRDRARGGSGAAPLAGRPARAGQAQPDARRPGADATTATTASTRCSCRSAWPTGSASRWPAATATRSTSRAPTPVRSRQPRPHGDRGHASRAVGGGWSGGPGPAPRPSPRASRSGSRSRRGSVAGRRTRPRPIDGALEAWGAELDPDARLRVAAGVGSDVPFFLAGGPALVEGRGEQVTPLDGLRGAPGVLLVTPAVHVSDAGRLRRVRRDPRARRRRHADDLGAPRRGARARSSPRRTSSRAPGSMAVANDLLPAAAHARPGARAVPAGAHPAPGAARSGCPAPGRPSGRSILPRRRPARPPTRSRPPSRRDASRPPATRRRSSHATPHPDRTTSRRSPP